MSIAKQAKAVEQQIKRLEQVEKSANSAVTRANAKADAIVAEARVIEAKSKAMLEQAEARLKKAIAAEETNKAIVLAAQEKEQNVNAFARRLEKKEDKIAEQRAILDRDIEDLANSRAAVKDRVKAFEDGIQAACKAAIG